MNVLLVIIILYIVIDLIKSIIFGPTFSMIRFILYKKDYMKWYTFKQKYIPEKNRKNFKSSK